MSASPRNNSHCPKLCHLSCSLIRNTPSKVPIFSCFWDLKIFLCRNSEIFHRCTHADTDSRLLFQKRSKSMQDKWPKVCIVLLTKTKMHFGILRCNLWGDFPRFFTWVCTVTPHLYSEFHPVPFRFGGDITKKPLQEPQSECNIASLSLHY